MTDPTRLTYVCDGRQHAVTNVRFLGPVEIEICADPACARMEAYCNHEVVTDPVDVNEGRARSICAWDEAKGMLACTFCGKDVTRPASPDQFERFTDWLKSRQIRPMRVRAGGTDIDVLAWPDLAVEWRRETEES